MTINRVKRPHKPAKAAKAAPAAQPAKTPRKPLEPLTIEQRFAIGCFDIREAAQLCSCSPRAIIDDIDAGRLAAQKLGGRVRILGPELVRHMNTPRRAKKAGGAS